jgi:hypothetical protein
MNELEEPGKLLASVTHDNAFALEHTPAKAQPPPMLELPTKEAQFNHEPNVDDSAEMTHSLRIPGTSFART